MITITFPPSPTSGTPVRFATSQAEFDELTKCARRPTVLYLPPELFTSTGYTSGDATCTWQVH